VPERDSYKPGTFAWAELQTTDADAAKAFYRGLFGWEAEDTPIGDGGVYTMLRLDGKDVGALYAGQQEGMPPFWGSYVSVEDADVGAERAKDLGGKVLAGPFDVMRAGRMAVIQDPQDAFFMVWQPYEHFGATLVNAPGALVWNELSSPDLDASTAFYTSLFGWAISPLEGSPEPYLWIRNGETANGGIRELREPGVPPHWLPYFGTEDVDDALAQGERLGGSTLAGPIDISIARIAVVRDPQGAAFALYAGQLDP
jgi:uncharacterized protein